MSRTLPAASTVNGSAMSSSLFITNLRLLDLDLRPDWPSISTQTFSTKDANQNQKQRIRCVEWALFRLFELWDPEEARDKLQPFFPPLEPLQSLNLRAALFRSLNELKKNGALGRETTLRKTMLDDCRGDKFMEVLVVFSTNVLRKRVTGGRVPKHAPASFRLATAPNLDIAQQRSLLPLTIAYQASLKALLERRAALTHRYASFSNLIDESALQLKAREQTRHPPEPRNISDDAIALHKQITDAWVGNTKWVDVILHGEEDGGDQIFSQPFEDVWRASTRGKPIQSVVGSPGLQENLELRVQQQTRRISRWKVFQSKLADSSSRDTAIGTKTNPAALAELRLTSHSLEVIGGEAGDGPGGHHTSLSHAPSKHYENSLASMRTDISSISSSLRQRSAQLGDAALPEGRVKRHDGPRLSALHVADGLPQVAARPPRNTTGAGPGDDSALSLGDSSQQDDVVSTVRGSDLRSPTPETPSASTPGDRSTFSEPREPEPVISSPHDEHASPTPSARDDITPSTSQEEQIASQIISSVSDASPSPPPSRPFPLSLAERTRMSIAHAMPRQETARESSSSQHATADVEQPTGDLPPDAETPFDRRASLLERTRQSMSRLPASNVAQHKSRKSIAAMKRTSLFPVNQFETPRRQPSLTLTEHSEEAHGPGSSTPKELLFSEAAEYSSVFKSRPKVALSPVYTPQEAQTPPSLDGAMDLDASFGSSPLGRIGLGATKRA